MDALPLSICLGKLTRPDSVEQLRILSDALGSSCRWVVVKNEAHSDAFKLYETKPCTPARSRYPVSTIGSSPCLARSLEEAHGLQTGVGSKQWLARAQHTRTQEQLTLVDQTSPH
jgi:hypothetical protein